ncbi:transmembrane protein C2orf18-like protein [Sarcoptes scabiei]|uniref:Transmembrane protein C2orf18-like protein n=1 Tax=Sarcoptes scabiei TaxID=52283 RepID=A0A132ACG9_SARSC|nr:transmembrane protein C2orf18-like protein [Sarcoptes scabiei]
MAWTNYQIFLALLMVVTGSINTLATKWADDSNSKGRDGKIRPFDHPFVQAAAMFFGEFLCFIVYKLMIGYYRRKNYDDEQYPDSIKGNRQFSAFIFMPPALCDMTATSIMYIGLNLTNSSSFQMFRGALIIFTGILSVIFLKRRLKLYQWIGMFLVMGGLVIVGDFLIIVAQIITATQMIVEERFVSGSNVSPLQAVGWEGIFGFITITILLIPMYFIKVGGDIFKNPNGQIEDVIDAFYQIKNSWQVTSGLSGTILSIAFFNFAGISVTKQLSATTRTVLDSIRTIVIWIVSLIEKEEEFSFFKLGGFGVLLLGMCVYNDILIRPFFVKICCKENDEERNDLEENSENIIS